MSVLRRKLCLLCQHRMHCSFPLKTAKSWQIHRYGGPEELRLNVTDKLLPVLRPNDVIIHVHAASINPIDIWMLGGYGARLIGVMRQLSNYSEKLSEFPITLGRDFSGIVIDKGQAVKDIKPGDEVWGAFGPDRTGSHSEYVVADVSSISLKPTTIGHAEAASIPYAALTAWSALCLFGRLSEKVAHSSRVLILGGSGGVGVFAIQLLKSWGADVTTTCSTDAVEMLRNIGADYVLDYKLEDVKKELQNHEKFDVILDCVGRDSPSFALDLLKSWNNSKYITLVSPLFRYTDRHGLALGLLLSAAEAGQDTIKSGQNGQSLRWAYFCPNGEALKTIKSMVEDGKIMPIVEKIYPFDDTPNAYRKLLEGHARGKTVIEI